MKYNLRWYKVYTKKVSYAFIQMYQVTFIHVSLIKTTKETLKKSIKLFIIYMSINYTMQEY